MQKRLISQLLGLAILAAQSVQAGPDDDAVFTSDLTNRNQVLPIQNAAGFADFPTNIDSKTGLRIMPPTASTLLEGQRFDLRVETQIPAITEPELRKLTVNGRDITEVFLEKINSQGLGRESGTPLSNLLFGATARNLSFRRAGQYTVEATVEVDNELVRVTNTYYVSSFKDRNKVDNLVFFLGDGIGQPLRTAARIYQKGVFEGRSQGRLNFDQADQYGIVMTPSFDSIITDSAPGMASYISGIKQPNNALNVSADNTPEDGLDNPRIETIFEYLKRVEGFKLGVVSDAYIVDATPGSSVAHVRSRGDRDTIAQQFIGFFEDGTAQDATGFASLQQLNQPLDVILGGGARYFVAESDPELESFWQETSSGRSEAEQDLFNNVAPSLGYNTVRTLEELENAANNQLLLGIFSGEGRDIATGLDDRNLPGALDRLVARGQATIGGLDAAGLGMLNAPDEGSVCGATVQECFANVPSKVELIDKAISVLDGLSQRSGGRWALLIEQSHSDKFGHPLEHERAVYEVLELDKAIGFVVDKVAKRNKGLVIVTSDHAQTQSNIGSVLPDAIVAGGATPPGDCFSLTDGGYPITLGGNDADRPCALQDTIGTFNDGTPPTYQDANQDGFPDDPDPSVKLVVEQAGRPTYAQDYKTNPAPQSPAEVFGRSTIPNSARDPQGILLTGNMPSQSVAGSAAKTTRSVGVAPHSSDDVILAAFGEGAQVFGGVYENSDVSIRIGAAFAGVKRFTDDDRGKKPNGRFLEFD